MSIVVTYLAYLLISIGLTALVGRVLSRSGRMFLLDALGGSDRAARGISNLVVVCFYLVSGGFIVLAMRTSADSVTARQAIQLLATKIGEVLLLLSALYLTGIVTLAWLRRRLGTQQATDAGARPEPSATPRPAASLTSPGLWRPAPKRTAQ